MSTLHEQRRNAMRRLERLAARVWMPMDTYFELAGQIGHGDLRFFESVEFFVKNSHPDDVIAAIADARAEAHARANGWQFVWQTDAEGWRDVEPHERKHVSAVLWAGLYDPDVDERLLASLGAIWEGHDAAANKRYRRVIEAGLAAEAIAQLGAG